MRLTSLILLASAALAFTVQAQERHIVDVVLQVNGEIQTQDGQPPAPDVTAPRRQGQTNEPQPMGPAIPEVIAPKQPGKGVVQADAVDPFAPEVAAPKPRNHSLQANAVRPACPQVTAPRRESIGDAPKVNFDGAVASVDDEDETFDVVADGAKRKGRAKGKGHRTGKRHRTGKCQCKGGKMGEVPTRTTYPKFKVDVPGPEVTAPKMPGRRFEDEEPFADSADPEVTAPKVPGKGIKKIVKVKILRRGDDVVVGGAGDAVPGPDVTAPAPKVTAPIVETNGVTAPGPKVAAPSRPDKHIAEVKVRVNGKVVTDGDEALENVQVVIPDPDVTAPAPPKPGTTAPSNPDKHIAEAKVVHEESALEEKLSASNSEKKTAGLLDGLPDGLRDGLLDGLLGIDINLDGKKSKKAPADDDEKDWHHLRLYGDDGYEPRPLPVQPDAEPNCETLSFRDQMIWDQQGNRGHYVNVPNSNAEKAPEEGIPKAETIANSADDGTDAAPPPSSSSPHTYEIINGKKIADIKDNKGTVDANGIHICLLGPCDDDSVDEDTRIHHKMKKFLKQFKGKALRIDSRTGCPLSSDKPTQENS